MSPARSNGQHHHPGEAPRGSAHAPLRDDPIDRNEKGQMEHLLDLLYRGRWIVLVTLLAVFGAVTAYTFAQEETYRTSSLVLISNQTNSSSGLQASQFGYAAGSPFARNNNSLENQLLILRNSMELARNVAYRLRYAEDLPAAAPLALTTAEATDSIGVERLAKKVKRQVSFSTEGRETSALRITATSTLPAEAALLANLYTEEYVRLTRDASRTSLNSQRRFLEQQQEMWRDSLDEASAALETFMLQENAIALDQEQSNLVSRIGGLESQRDDVSLELQTRREQLRLLQNRLARIDTNLVERISSSVDENLATAQQELARRRLERQDILLRNPSLAVGSDTLNLPELGRKIRDLEQQIDELAAEYVAEVRAAGTAGGGGSEDGSEFGQLFSLDEQIAQAQIEISGLEARQGVINERLGDYRTDLNALPGHSMTLRNLQRRLGYAEQTYQTVNSELQRTRIEEQAELGYADIISEADEPSSPVSPNKTRNLIAGLFGGLFLGIGLALMRYATDRRLYAPEDLHDKGLNVIGVVPDMEDLVQDEHRGADYVEQDGRRFSTGLVTLFNPLTAASESFRHLRTNIQFSLPDTVVETLLVTSPNKGEGKSLNAANLAVVMAQAGRRTLIVDADLRRPRVHRMFGLQREPGLVEHLFGQKPVDLEGETLATGIDNLYACAAGQSVPNPAELLGSQSMRDFVLEARQHFDVVIFDTPPVLVATDAPLLSTQCDATIVVTQAASTRSPELDQTLKSLAGVGARVIGTILNRFDATMTYGYDYKYRYYAQDYYHEEAAVDAQKNRLSRLLGR